MAELYELQLGDNKRALEAYDTTATWFETDNAEALANKNWIKVAELAAEEEQYPRAVECFEKVGYVECRDNGGDADSICRSRDQPSITI